MGRSLIINSQSPCYIWSGKLRNIPTASLHSLNTQSAVIKSQNLRVHKKMGIRFPEMVVHAKQVMRRKTVPSSHKLVSRVATAMDVPRGHFAVYVGEMNQNKRFVVPISYLKHPLFQDLLLKAEEEFGFDHPMGGLTIPCREDDFINLTYHLNSLLS